MAYHAFKKSAKVASMCWLHYENHFQYTHTTCMTTFQLVTMNNSQPIDIFNMTYLLELETFYDHVDQNSVKRTMVMLTINISKMTYVVYFI